MTTKKVEYEEAIKQYREQGVCHIPAFFPSDYINTLITESSLLWQNLCNRTAANLRVGLRANANGETVLDRLDPVADISDTFKAFNENTRLLALVELLMGEKPRIMKEKLIFKNPGTGGFGLHRDEPYFNASGANGDELVSVTVALDRFTQQNGPICLYPTLRYRQVPVATDEPRDLDVSVKKLSPPLTPLLETGDLLIFDGNVPHCSDFNRSSQPRRIYMVTYIPARFTRGREAYYRQRLIEQKEERRGNFEGNIDFD